MVQKSSLDDPATAAQAWARYRRLLRFMFVITLAVVVIALTLMYSQVGNVSPHFFIATALGIGFSMLLMSALMGLVFLSSATGHDQAVDDVSKTKTVNDEESESALQQDEGLD